MKKIFKKSFNCHCDECANTTKQSTLSKWIAALPAVARNDGKYHKTKREKNILFWRRFGHCLSTKQNIFDRLVIKRAAFTLAEVLITLVIIGVIAALTIPNLMQKYKKHQVEVQLKEAYSILNNALNMAKAEHGSLDEILSLSFQNEGPYEANYFTDNYLKPYLKYTKSCPNTRDCEDIFKTKDYILADITGTYSNLVLANPTQWSRLALSNGMYLGIFSNYNSDNPGYTFVVDINGGNNPNKIGHDIFYFCLENASPNRLMAGRYAKFSYDSQSYKDLLKGTYCNTSSTPTNGGAQCSAAIMGNGWKIPDDYPVKKW